MMKYALALLPLLALTACGDPAPMPRLFCPQVAVLAETNTLNRFLPDRQDVAALVTEAQITGVAGACTLEPAKKTLVVTFKAGFTATNGPANTSENLDLPYFVSISQDDTIVHKDEYSIPLRFDGNVTSASATSKTFKVELPNSQESARIDILVGFQLTQEQLAYAAAHPK